MGPRGTEVVVGFLLGIKDCPRECCSWFAGIMRGACLICLAICLPNPTACTSPCSECSIPPNPIVGWPSSIGIFPEHTSLSRWSSKSPGTTRCTWLRSHVLVRVLLWVGLGGIAKPVNLVPLGIFCRSWLFVTISHRLRQIIVAKNTTIKICDVGSTRAWCRVK